MKYLTGCITAILIFILISCNSDYDYGTQPDNQPTEPTFTSINKTVFQASCAFTGCHASDTKKAGLNLSSSAAYTNLVNVLSSENPTLKRVDPGNSTNSYILKKLKGEGTTRMPLNRQPLSQEKIDAIIKWIDDGAQNN